MRSKCLRRHDYDFHSGMGICGSWAWMALKMDLQSGSTRNQWREGIPPDFFAA